MRICEYFCEDTLPHIWCAGCGHGIVLGSLLRAVDAQDIEKDDVALVSGIGCVGRAPGYVDFNTMHVTHGRALPFATGIKLGKPGLNVVALMGDGDCAAIGGNHFIHACRRNIDITAIVSNNNIYGMTGGQFSPTTPHGDRSTTSPYGNIDQPFDIYKLAQAAGSTYVARWTTYHTRQLIRSIRRAMEHRGFSFVEVISQCPVQYGRRNRRDGPVEMMRWMRDHAVDVHQAKDMTAHELRGKFLIGEFAEIDLPEYTELIQMERESARRDQG